MQPPARAPRPALHVCALTLHPHTRPVVTPDGIIFEHSSILPLIQRTNLNPITGISLHPTQLVPLHFTHHTASTASNPLYICPYQTRPITAVDIVLAHPTTGVVYIGNERETDAGIVIYHPARHVWSGTSASLASESLSSPAGHPRRARKRGTTGVDMAGSSAPLKRPRTSVVDAERRMVYKRVRKGRKGKAYVRVVTNVGHLNIELHCDKTPLTCDNFLTLSERGYYDNVPFHRVIPRLFAQTGDPTGTGTGGMSAWGGCVKDEIRSSLCHERGSVSMANAGKDTNRSQWFICFDKVRHLDGAHTVFGNVVGGLFVLEKMECEGENSGPLTVEKVEVLVNPIRQIREAMQKPTPSVPPPVSMGRQDERDEQTPTLLPSHPQQQQQQLTLPPASTLFNCSNAFHERFDK